MVIHDVQPSREARSLAIDILTFLDGHIPDLEDKLYYDLEDALTGLINRHYTKNKTSVIKYIKSLH